MESLEIFKELLDKVISSCLEMDIWPSDQVGELVTDAKIIWSHEIQRGPGDAAKTSKSFENKQMEIHQNTKVPLHKHEYELSELTKREIVNSSSFLLSEQL